MSKRGWILFGRTSTGTAPCPAGTGAAVRFAVTGVPIAGVATFEFPLGPALPGATQAFEAVADGACWLPDTAFLVTT